MMEDLHETIERQKRCLDIRTGDRRLPSVLVIAGCHGMGPTVINFILWIHFIKPIYMIEPFEYARAALLLILTSVIGGVVGLLAASIWNRLQMR